jgi:hypothetical protein
MLRRALPLLERLGDFIGNGEIDPQRPGSLGERCDLIGDIKSHLRTDDAAKLARLSELANALHDDSPLSPDLFGYAASDALQYVLANWRDAVACGEPLTKLLPDLPQVIQQLAAFEKEAVRIIHSEEASRCKRG